MLLYTLYAISYVFVLPQVCEWPTDHRFSWVGYLQLTFKTVRNARFNFCNINIYFSTIVLHYSVYQNKGNTFSKAHCSKLI